MAALPSTITGTGTGAETKIKEEGDTSKSLLLGIVQKSRTSDDPLIQKALAEEQAFRVQTEKELSELVALIQKCISDTSEEERAKIKKDTLERLKIDFELMTRLNTALDPYQPKDTEPQHYSTTDCYTCTYPAKFNKMAILISAATDFVTSHFNDICNNKLPPGYSFHSELTEVTMLGANPDSIYGDSKGSILKTAVLNVLLSCHQNTRLQQQISIDHSALAHVTALPESLDLLSLDERFDKFTYLFSEESTFANRIQTGLVYCHSGYTFGGHRDIASRYRGGTKLFGPEDCSSWVSKLCRSPVQFSTLDQLYLSRLQIQKTLHFSLSGVPSGYISTPVARTMCDLFDSVVVKDPQRDIRPGQIYAHRTYDSADASMDGPGKVGHTGLVLDFVSAAKDSKLVILAYGRNMLTEEGFGVQTCPFAPDNRRVLLFSVKSQTIPEGGGVGGEEVKLKTRLEKKASVGLSSR